MPSGRVILRQYQDPLGLRYLEAELDSRGNLVISGHDLGPGVERCFGEGCREYEWVWTVRAADVPTLRRALGLGQMGDLLLSLRRRFSGERSSGLKAFLDEQGVPHEVWSRTGS